MGRRTPPRARPPGKGDVGTGAVMLVFFRVAVVGFSALGWIDDLAVPPALPLMICLDVALLSDPWVIAGPGGLGGGRRG